MVTQSFGGNEIMRSFYAWALHPYASGREVAIDVRHFACDEWRLVGLLHLAACAPRRVQLVKALEQDKPKGNIGIQRDMTALPARVHLRASSQGPFPL
ncbi:hypothetical protein [Alteripontixanthobacter maritimus]|uniref:hypothetical protein n=1 Tax=Alteripontixanthobacter maritimus TaxID=2161824 RepID=UPI0011C0410D|nr:hypothetical protein [Alteripontixanthobacter maritimus]